MPWYKVVRQDGSVVEVEATSKSEASQKVRFPGELIKSVTEIKVPTTTTATTPATTLATTPTTTTTPTPTPTPTPATYTPAGLTPPPIPTTPTTYSQSDIDSYNKYLEYIKTHPSWPKPKDIADYLANRDLWESYGDYYDLGYTDQQIKDYESFKRYASKYGTPDDWYPSNLADYLKNYSKAQEQLTKWKSEAPTEYTDEQIREFNLYKQYASAYGEPGQWYPVDIQDYFTNYTQAKKQLTAWQKQATQEEKEQLAAEEYALSPEEAARRREEGYAEERYAAKERYGEAPEYAKPFSQFIEQQTALSGALRGFVQNKYSSLRTEFEAGLPTLTGYATREEARAEAARREAGFQAWLPEQLPEVYQEYASQRPLERGERPYMYQPTTRTVNW